MRAEPWASRWGRGYERAPRFRTEPRGRAPRSRGAERRGIPVRYLEEFRAPAPTAIGRGATGANLGSRSWCPEPEVRHPIRRRLDDAGCVAPPRNSANYSSSSRLATAADPPPTLATDFGSGTLASAREPGARRLEDVLRRAAADQHVEVAIAGKVVHDGGRAAVGHSGTVHALYPLGAEARAREGEDGQRAAP